MYLSIVIPAYNEEKNLEISIFKFVSYLEAKEYDYEIIIVNDGSTDKTRDVCLKIIDKNKKIKLINDVVNRGKGYAVRAGFKNAVGDFMLFIDADNATSIDHLDKAEVFMDKGYDLIIGSRSTHDAQGARQRIKQVYWKRMMGLYGNFIIRKLTNEKIRDTQCGFKILKKDFAKKIIPKLTIDRWGFDVEIIAMARLFRAKIEIIPVVWNNSDMSRVGIKGYFASLKDVLKIRKNMKEKKYEID